MYYYQVYNDDLQSSILAHETNFTQDEFESLIKNAMIETDEMVMDADVYLIAEFLINNYGFKPLTITYADTDDIYWHQEFEKPIKND
jgi:hypothetical protein